jgi:hypothetical protein
MDSSAPRRRCCRHAVCTRAVAGRAHATASGTARAPNDPRRRARGLDRYRPRWCGAQPREPARNRRAPEPAPRGHASPVGGSQPSTGRERPRYPATHGGASETAIRAAVDCGGPARSGSSRQRGCRRITIRKPRLRLVADGGRRPLRGGVLPRRPPDPGQANERPTAHGPPRPGRVSLVRLAGLWVAGRYAARHARSALDDHRGAIAALQRRFTRAVRCEVEDAEPTGFVAVTSVRIDDPQSSSTRAYAPSVAPGIGLQRLPFTAQRSHW